MPFLILLLFPILEIVVAIQVADEMGFLPTAGFFALAALVGFLLLSFTGRAFLLELQVRVSRGENLEKVLFSQAFRFLAGLLFLLPGFVSDAVALVFLVTSFFPSLVEPSLNRQAKRWGSRFVVFKSSTYGAPGSSGSVRDVTPGREVIDVTPESSGVLGDRQG